MTDNINGKVVAITGASTGLGAETARHLSKAGAKSFSGRVASTGSSRSRVSWAWMENRL